MQPVQLHPLRPLLRNLQAHSSLDHADQAAILSLPSTLRSFEPGSYLVREGDGADHCWAILDGFAYRHKMTTDGQRQIVALHLPGEFADLQNLFLGVADHNVQALTRVEAALVPCAAIREIAAASPAINQVLFTDTLVDSSICREWILNVGRRDARSRIAHLLCEIGFRLETLGLGKSSHYELPMTQEQIGDACGLTPVHVNRILKQLERDGLIVRHKRLVSIPDWDMLRKIGDFTTRYLHAGRAEPVPAASAAE